MRKEVIIAILVGISIGLVVAYGVRIAQTSIALSKKQLPKPSPILTATQASQSSQPLFITSPKTDDVIMEKETTIIGTTTPQSMVNAITDSDDNSTIADSDGAFTIPVTLNGGPNVVKVTSFSPAGDQAETILTIVYSSADLTATPAATKKGSK